MAESADLRSLIEEHSKWAYSAPARRDMAYNGGSASSSTSTTSTHSQTSPSFAMSSSSSAPPTPGPFSLPSSYMSTSATSSSVMSSSPPPSPMPDCPSGYTVPPNFGLIAKDVYRSSFPRLDHFPYLRTLGLRTVLVLVLEDYPADNRRFVESEGIDFIQLGMPNNKDPLAQIPGDVIRRALAVVLDKRKYPLLVHCNRGKHRTGCLVGCLRKMQRWSQVAALEEYSRYAHPKERVCDEKFVASFSADEAWASIDRQWLPAWCAHDAPRGHDPMAARKDVIPTRATAEPQTGVQVLDGG